MIKLAHPMISEEERRAVLDVLASGQLAQGPRVAEFEEAFAEYVGVRHAVAVNSGTAALHLSLLIRGIGPGDEVIVPAFSFAATANTVLHAGARPVFVDVRDDDFGIDVTEIDAAITSATKAIVAVHLYGQMCDMERVAETCATRGLALIEDAAQAIGAALGDERAGSWDTGAFSFYATKNLQTGEGGMITTNDDAVAARARWLRSQGESTRYVTEEAGFNYRMTEIAAALGIAQMSKIEARNEQRRANARRLSTLLVGCKRIITPRELPGRRHVWHQYTIRVPEGRDVRDALRAGLRERGIETAVFYPAPIHKQPLYHRLGYGDIHLPMAERLSAEVLALPVHPSLSAEDLTIIADAVIQLMR